MSGLDKFRLLLVAVVLLPLIVFTADGGLLPAWLETAALAGVPLVVWITTGCFAAVILLAWRIAAAASRAGKRQSEKHS